MTRRSRRFGKTLTVVLLALASRAAADPAPAPAAPDAPGFSVLHSPRIACREADLGDCVRLKPGFYLDDDSYGRLDAEMKRLQDAETRLDAENKSLRASASGWEPGWKTLATTIASGVALGWYLHSKI